MSGSKLLSRLRSWTSIKALAKALAKVICCLNCASIDGQTAVSSNPIRAILKFILSLQTFPPFQKLVKVAMMHRKSIASKTSIPDVSTQR